MTALGPGEIRARRRPGVIVMLTALRLGAGFCLALPIQSLIASSGVGLRADGDRVLFEGGGYLLLEVLRQAGPSLDAVARGLVPLFAVALLLTAVSNALLFVALDSGGRLRLREWLARSLGRVPGLLVLGTGTGLGQLVLLTLGGALAAAVPDSMLRPVASSAGFAAVWLVLAGAAGALGGFADLAKACVVRHDAGVLAALRQATACLRRRPILSCFGWLPYAVPFLLAIALGAKLTEAVDVSRAGTWRIVVVFGVHQLIVLFAVALRAAWFARALRLSAS